MDPNNQNNIFLLFQRFMQNINPEALNIDITDEYVKEKKIEEKTKQKEERFHTETIMLLLKI